MEENNEMREDFAEKSTEETSEERTEETLPTQEASEEGAFFEPISEEAVAPDASDEDYADAEAADISYVPAEAAVTMTSEAQAEREEAPEEEPDEEIPEESSFEAPTEEQAKEAPAEEAEEMPAQEEIAEAPVEEDVSEEGSPFYEESETKEEAPETLAEESVEAAEEMRTEEVSEDAAIAEPLAEDEPLAEGALKEEAFIEETTADAAEEILPADAEESADAPVVLPVSESEEAPAEKAAEPEKKQETPEYTWQELKLRRKYKMDHDPLFHANDVIPGFIIARGEKVIRTYNCLASDAGDGTVCLTNRRLLVNAGERSEVAVEQISGIKFSRRTRFYFWRFFFALLFTAIAVAAVLLPHLNKLPFAIPNITGEARKTWAVILCYVGGGIGALISLPIWLHIVKKTFYFFIYAHQDTPFVQCKSASYIKSEAKGKVASCMVAKAGKESEKAARELGALLIEIKEGRFDD